METTMRGVYTKDIVVKENGWRLFVAEMASPVSGRTVETTCSGVFTPMYEGQPFLFIGEYVSYKGSQTFKVKTYTAEIPVGIEESMAFIRSGKGIGKKRGTIICDYCEGDLTRLTMADVSELKERCPGLKEANIQKLIERLNQVKKIAELQKVYGGACTIEQLARIVTKFGDRVESVMKYHPYWTASLVGFKVADCIGEVDKVAANDIERVSAAVKYQLNALCHLNNAAMAVTVDVVKSTMSLLSETKLGGVSEEDVRNAMNSLREKKEICRSGKYCYPRKNFEYEKLISEFVVYNSRRVSLDKQDAFQEAFDDWRRAHKNMQLSAMQTAAVWMAGTNVVSTITGGPGTGKTTCLQALIESFHTAFPKENITLIAPTGLAAKRMTEKTGYPAKTIHSAFRLIPEDDTDKDEFEANYNDALVQRIDSGLVVVDEFSMVGLDLSAFLIDHTNFADGRSQIVFVGDVDQLPPISCGSVLKAMIDSQAVPTTVLDRNFRQTEMTGIPELAADINEGNLNISLTGGCSFEQVATNDKTVICKEITNQYLNAVKQYGIKNVLVLAPLRKETERSGPICSDCLNRILRDAINPAKPGLREMKIGERVFREGDRVINLKNAADCVNGDIGTVVSISAGGELMTIEMDCGSVLNFEKQRVSKAIELAYSVTVHKSQGGEYSAIIFPCVAGQDFMLKRPLAYTAITRAKKQFVGIGDINLLKAAGQRDFGSAQPKDLLAPRIMKLSAQFKSLHGGGAAA